MRETETNLFSTTVNNHRGLFVRHQLPPPMMVDFVGIDRHTTFFRGELKQTQFRTISVLGNELGVERNQSRLLDVIAQVIEGGLFGNKGRRHRRSSRGWRVWHDSFSCLATAFYGRKLS